MHAALRLMLGVGGKLADDGQVVGFAQFASQRGIDLGRTWVADRRGRVVWAVLPVPSPGRTALLLAGQVPASEAAAAAALVEASCADVAAGDVQLAQVLLDPADAVGARAFAAAGFRVMAELVYLQATVRRALPPPLLPAGFGWVNYSAETHDAFASTILETYRDSLDCPGLNGLRHVEDVIAGHKASGEFDPAYWFLVAEEMQNDECRMQNEEVGTNGQSPHSSFYIHHSAFLAIPRGVLLLSKMPRADAVELVYLGLTPAARGRGLGALMFRQALTAVAAAGGQRLTLAVDAGNAPAMKLYFRHGMQRVGVKTALMRVLDPVTPAGGGAT